MLGDVIIVFYGKKYSFMSLTFFDSHCHFDFSVYDERRDNLWRECQQKSIKYLLIPGVEPGQWQTVQTMVEKYSGMLMAAGIHPWWSESAVLPLDEQWLSILQEPYCVAIGECGLDAVIETPLEKQQQLFERHVQMAVDLSKPLIIHVRQTHQQTLQLLKKYRPSCGGVIHGFTGSQELAMQYWRMGFYLGIGGSITYPRANKTRTMAKEMPLEALLLETDAPDMPLQGYQGQANSPLRVIEVAQALAELRQQTLDTIANVTTNNSKHLFGLAN